jgi:hypothetical protein
MHVILSASEDDRLESLVFSDASHVSSQLRLEFFGDGFRAALGAENHVNAIAEIRVWHCVVPPGLGRHWRYTQR